jgi:hypothetical protein
MEIAGVYDIETEDWDRFVCGGLLTVDGTYFEATWKSERDLVEAILRIDGTVIAHNGGHFDHLWFLDALYRFGLLDSLSVEISMSGSSIVRCHIKGPTVNLILADSWRFFPMSLRKLSNGAKDETGMRCKGEGDCADIIAYRERYDIDPGAYGCGGYCAISRSMAPADLKRVMAYCEQDCRALLDGITHMLGVAEGLGVDVTYTVGGTAWRTARAMTDVGVQPFQGESESLYYYARSGYYGGRVGLFSRLADRGFQYDITSSYPYQCSQPLPVGDFEFVQATRAARAAYAKGKPGIYTAYVTVPECFIPPLPVRAQCNGEKRLAFPTGSFQGTWALPELQYAESLGCEIMATAALTFSDEQEIFTRMMDDLISARLRYGKKTREGEWLKLVANSLYGKLASRPEVKGIFLNPSPAVVLHSEYPLERVGARIGLYIQTRDKIPDCSHVVWAAYITARGRVQLHRMLTANGGHDALYCDTDSCFTTRERGADDGIGTGLGLWQYEGPFSHFHGIAPKIYRYERDGKPTLKAKGVVLPGDFDKAWSQILAGKPVKGRTGVKGLKSVLHKEGPLFQRSTVTRLVKEGFGDRIPDGAFSSRPPRAEELTFLTEDTDDADDAIFYG